MIFKIKFSLLLVALMISTTGFCSDPICDDILKGPNMTRLNQKLISGEEFTDEDTQDLRLDIRRQVNIDQDHQAIIDRILKQNKKSAIILDLLVDFSQDEFSIRAKINLAIGHYLIQKRNEEILFEQGSSIFDVLTTVISFEDQTYPLQFSDDIKLSVQSLFSRLMEVKKQHPEQFQTKLLPELDLHLVGLGDRELIEFSDLLSRSKSVFQAAAAEPGQRRFRSDLRRDLSELKDLVAEITRNLGSPNLFDYLELKSIKKNSAQKIIKILEDQKVISVTQRDPMVQLSDFVFKYRLLKNLNSDLTPTQALVAFEESINYYQSLFSNLAKNSDTKKYLLHLDQDAKDQQAVVKSIAADPYFKLKLFDNSSVVKELRTAQKWITVANPKAVKNKFEALSKKQQEDVGRALNISLNNPETHDSVFAMYADDLLKNIEALNPDQNKNRVVLRYVARTLGDLELGSDCGDCTAVGSINFGRSSTWLYNPHYQILTFSKGKRFLGKMHLSLADLNHRPIVLIDALEFNPQAHEGLPYHEDAREAFDSALEFVKKFAQSEGRDLVALTASNSTEANQILISRGNNKWLSKKGFFQFPLDEDPIRRSLQFSKDFNLQPYYQSVERGAQEDAVGQFDEDEVQEEGVGDFEAEEDPGLLKLTNAPQDPALADLEREVFNPAQAKYPEFAKTLISLRNTESEAERNILFKTAASILLNDPVFENKIQSIYKLPAGVKPSWKFIATRLTDLYLQKPSSAAPKAGVILNLKNFVRIPTNENER